MIVFVSLLALTAHAVLAHVPAGSAQTTEVKTAAELRARTPAEVARANFFGADGTPLAQAGDTVTFSTGEPTAIFLRRVRRRPKAVTGALSARGATPQDRTRASDGPRVVQSFAELRPATDLERRRASLLDNPYGIPLEGISKESFFVAHPHKAGNARFWADDIFPLTEEEKLRIVLRDQICEADVVLLAHSVSEHAYLNKSETGFVTDVVLVAERWIRPLGTVASPTKLTASFRGGGARIREQDIGDEGANPILGEAYVFFLRFLKEAETFTGSGVHSIQGRVDEYPALNTPLDDYLKRLDEAATGCSKGRAPR